MSLLDETKSAASDSLCPPWGWRSADLITGSWFQDLPAPPVLLGLHLGSGVSHIMTESAGIQEYGGTVYIYNKNVE